VYTLLLILLDLATSHTLKVHEDKSTMIAKLSKGVESAFTRMTTQIEGILEVKKFSTLRRACIQRINSLGSNLPRSLVPKIQQTHTLDDMLDVLAQSPYWNWFDTRLLQALVSASGSAEAEEWLESFKATFYAEKVANLIPYVSIKPFRESINLVEKFDKDPEDLTISELLQHKYKLEYEVLDIDEGELALSCIKTGCVELTWQVPQELVYRAYTSMKKKHENELSSLAVKSLVCEEADEFEGLPILWHGQEIGEVGPIEPLPEHVRQQPYSLPQGFKWVALCSSDVEEVVKFMNKKSFKLESGYFHSMNTHPHTRSEWQFGIRTTNGKLVGVVVAYPVCMSIGGVSVMCVFPTIHCHRKYHNKRLFYILCKEFQRRINLNKINQFFGLSASSLFAPVVTITMWLYDFTHPTRAQLPNSPSTPGWRKMTSEDVPSALALVNKYSSQFEIRQVFTSEEEFSHHFLCPAIPNHVFTYVVENESNNITDLVTYNVIRDKGKTIIFIIAMIFTHSPIKQLMVDTLVCAINNSADVIQLCQFKLMESDLLLSCGFMSTRQIMLHLYNYKYPEIKPTCYFCLL